MDLLELVTHHLASEETSGPVAGPAPEPYMVDSNILPVLDSLGGMLTPRELEGFRGLVGASFKVAGLESGQVNPT